MRTTVLGPVAGAAAIVVLALAAAAQEQQQFPARLLELAKGPKTIDVSKYPADMQARYKTFATKCSKCHTLAIPINSDFSLDEEWERYIKRMMRKPGSGIGSDDGKQIFEFLAYDSKIRKKELYERKLKEAAKPSGF